MKYNQISYRKIKAGAYGIYYKLEKVGLIKKINSKHWSVEFKGMDLNFEKTLKDAKLLIKYEINN